MTQDLSMPLAGSVVEVDEATAMRAAALAAYGCSDEEVCQTLIITKEQLFVAKSLDAYKQQFADKAQERLAQQIDISTGWDGVEQKAVAKVLSALGHTEDPNYALAAARVANQARRRVGMDNARTIDPSKVGQIMHIRLNQKFVTNVQNNGINVQEKSERTIEHKRVDMPNAGTVKDLLAPVRPLLQKMREHTIAVEMDELGFGNLGDFNGRG